MSVEPKYESHPSFINNTKIISAPFVTPLKAALYTIPDPVAASGVKSIINPVLYIALLLNQYIPALFVCSGGFKNSTDAKFLGAVVGGSHVSLLCNINNYLPGLTVVPNLYPLILSLAAVPALS